MTGYVTEEDSAHLKRVAAALQMKSPSEFVTAILERLCIGNFTPIAFLRVGYQVATALEKQKAQYRFDFSSAHRPMPPIIAEQPDPDVSKLIPFVRDLEAEIKIEAKREQKAS